VEPAVDEARARALVETARVARLGTVGANGRLALVPVTFALTGGRLVTAVDHKPKTTTRLRRLDDVRANPEVSVLVDEYDDADWTALWWVRVRGLAEVVEGGPRHTDAVDALVAKYPQYRAHRPTGPAIVIVPVRWQWWSATP
jgi:PPOX class probable F420-dependent enzyme